jgi:hypothetical protein
MLAFSKLTDSRSHSPKTFRVIVAVLTCLAWLAVPARSYAVCICQYEDGRFTINQNMVLNGQMGDWVNVHADGYNNCCDGGTQDIEPQPDRDAPV